MKRARFPRVAVALAALGTIHCATQADLQRTQRQSEEIRRLSADTQAMMDGLKRDVDSLRGEVEQLRFQSGSGGRATEDIVAQLEAVDARLAAVEAQLRGDGVTLGPVQEGEPGGPDDVRVLVAAALSDSRLPPDFREALSLLQAGKGEQAVPAFREFLRRSPGSDLADDAQYWVGEAYFSMRDYNRAILELNDVLLRYPKGDRVPAALFRQAAAFRELGDRVDAKLVLQKLVSDHPEAPEAERAKQQLLQLSP